MLTELEGLDYIWHDSASNAEELPDILIHHGTHDPVVTIDRGHKTRDTLTKHQIPHTYREYPMQHEISMTSIRDLRDWLASLN